MPVQNTFTVANCLDHLSSLALSPEAFAYAEQAFLSEPTRHRRHFAKGNVCGEYSAPSQGVSIEYRSHGLELAWILRWEFDPNILAYRDRPPAVEILRHYRDKRNSHDTFVPDFLLLTRDSVTVIDIRSESSLKKKVDEHGDEWIKEGESYCYLPVARHFAELGLQCQILSDLKISKLRTSNLKTILSAANDDRSVPERTRQTISHVLESTAWLSIADLLESIEECSLHPVLKLIYEGHLYADLDHQLVTQIDSCVVSLNADFIAHASAKMSEHAIGVPCRTQDLPVPSRKEMAHALGNLERLHSGERGRTVRRLKQRVIEGQKNGLSELQSLMPGRRGNHTSKLSPVIADVLQQHIRTHYMNPNRPTLRAAHDHYRQQARQEYPVFSPVSYPTYCHWVARETPRSVAAARSGRRSANSMAPATPTQTREIGAQRSFERACIDHTPLDLLAIVVESNGLKYVKRPWLTCMVDDYSGYWLAFWLSFDSPSRRAIAMSFRSCARRYGKLPEYIHSDQGAEFRSTYYRALTAHFGCTPDWSPPGNSRFNSHVEILNLQFQQQWIAKRPGNIIDCTNRRKLSKGYRPKDLAVLSLSDIFREVSQFQEHYNTTVIGNNYQPPETLFESSFLRHDYSGVPVTVDRDFLLVTAVDTAHSAYTINAHGEIVRDGVHYTHPALKLVRPTRNRTEIRIDPENPYLIYCRVQDRWVDATSSKHATFVIRNESDRWSESVRIIEGRSARDRAKEHARELIARRLEDIDISARVVDQDAQQAAAAVSDGPASMIIDSPTSFETMRTLPVRKLTASFESNSTDKARS